MPDSEQTPESDSPAEATLVPVRLRVNSTQHDVLIEPRRTLLSVLRRDLHLTGAKPGCEMGNCGACTVLLEGVAFYSCLLLAVECESRDITTIEGLAAGGALDPVQEAFIAYDAVQCGFCTPGQVLAVKALLTASPSPDDETISRGLSGNICRCGTYPKIIRAVRALTQNCSEPE